MKVIAGLALVWALGSVSICAESHELEIDGVWIGTLGKQNITACFNDQRSGSYYYARHLKPIPLSPVDRATNVWFERRDPSTGLMSFSGVHGDEMLGTWTKPDRTGALPLKLKRVLRRMRRNFDEGACGSASFIEALETEPRLIAEKETLSIDGKRYKRLKSVIGGSEALAATTIQLLPDIGEDFKLINASLLGQIPKNRAESASYFSCRRSALLAFGENGEAIKNVSPEFWSQKWLSARVSSFGACGDAHPYNTWGFVTWDLSTGREFDPWQWLGRVGTKSAVDENEPGVSTLPENWRFLVNVDQNCANSARHRYKLRPDRLGLRFELNTTNPDCMENIAVVSFEQLLPLVKGQARELLILLKEEMEAR